MSAVFKKSGVKNSHAHRYRHTLATRLLAAGASFELVADILGNTPEIVRKHYGKWSKGRQDNIDKLTIAHFASAPVTVPVTPQSHENGACKLMKIQQLKWCGEGDLNPHEIAPASTSSEATLFRGVSWRPKSLIPLNNLYRRLSSGFTKPLQIPLQSEGGNGTVARRS